jgi:hypothetical protein
VKIFFLESTVVQTWIQAQGECSFAPYGPDLASFWTGMPIKTSAEDKVAVEEGVFLDVGEGVD